VVQLNLSKQLARVGTDNPRARDGGSIQYHSAKRTFRNRYRRVQLGQEIDAQAGEEGAQLPFDVDFRHLPGM
jgi:hypothetical protein